MRFSFRRMSRIGLISTTLLIVIAVTTVALGVRRFGQKPLPTIAVTQTAVAAQADFTTLALNLTRFGFEPASVNVVAGNYLFSVRNMTGLDNVPLTITRKNGDKIISDTTKSGKRRWDQLVKLTPGDYMLSAASNPTWSCELSVLPPGK